LVERAKALVCERSRRPQFTGADSRKRPARIPNDLFDAIEAITERHRITKAHTLDFESGKRRNATTVLEHTWQESIGTRRKLAHDRHSFLLFDSAHVWLPPKLNCQAAIGKV
jgi:hypothetical protein